MLLLSDAWLVIFLQFLQILLWIAIPAFIIAMLITTLVHYRNKKRKSKKEEEQLIVENELRSYSGYDDFSLLPQGVYLPGSKHEVKGIIHHLFHSKARYMAIRKDYEILNRKYEKLHVNNHQDFETIIKNKTMETIQTDMQPTLHEQMESIKQRYEIEKRELYAELSQLTQAYENLEKDNNSLRDQLVAYSSDDNKTTAVIQKWETEKAELKKRISEQEYLRDVLEEKKLQIGFLQQQLEQRIKNHHLVEQQFRELGIKFMEVKEELEIKQQSEKEFQSGNHEKEQEIILLKEKIQSQTDHAAQLEASLKTAQEQNENFALVVESNSKLIVSLHEQLAVSSEIRKELERKLEKNNALLKGFHKKLSDVFEEEIAESPVIALKPVYSQENGGQLTESAIQ
jgi:chromosome segregation ATPase